MRSPPLAAALCMCVVVTAAAASVVPPPATGIPCARPEDEVAKTAASVSAAMTERASLVHIACRVGDVSVSACLDTGAQCCVMSESCAMRCGLLPLLDRRFEGRAVGVGSARILGRVRGASISLGGTADGVGVVEADDDLGMAIDTDLIILEGEKLGDGADVLLGLDALQRYGAVINLRERTLRMPAARAGRNGGDFVLPFLDENGFCTPPPADCYSAPPAGPLPPGSYSSYGDEGIGGGASGRDDFGAPATGMTERQESALEAASEALNERYEARKGRGRLSALERSEATLRGRSRSGSAKPRREWTYALSSTEPTAVSRGGSQRSSAPEQEPEPAPAPQADEDGSIDWWGADSQRSAANGAEASLTMEGF
eukprot:CAMPEP_0118854992 /NCGR_PEP_ID=MMETSP1163-20130328/2984_1 /TAXON_ID=124430 /ORGANISM="Phaeomonas parva, Strain CCMP2877" /LENGTH=371 /DNA_ID=CAMNT_0006787799 /DNA_START=489 /DNA_END=1604 /DNA_ORIENTATION=-